MQAGLRTLRLLHVLRGLLLTGAAYAESPGDAWWKHVAALADDSMQGREAGSEGHRKAVAYLEARFREVGLKPCFPGGFRQPVPLVRRDVDESKSSLAFVRGGKVDNWKLGGDAVISPRLTGLGSAPPVDAEAVFVGNAVSAPGFPHDDFAGIDVRGKVAVYLSEPPSSLPGTVAAHFTSTAERGRALRAAGAIGAIAILNPKTSDVPWERSVKSRLVASMAIDEPGLDPAAGLAFSATLEPAQSERVFAGTTHTYASILALADAGKPLPRFKLPFRVRARAAIREAKVESENVCGRLGDAPEVVALSAHIDHLGTGPAVDGDTVFNGAMDNASGIATMIEVSRALRGRKLRRSLMFVAVTAEEKGLLGSRYFAMNPPVDVRGIVANINFDMYLPIHAFTHLMVMGLDESTLGGSARQAASAMGLETQPDLEPKRNRFIRSDQYSFILRGVPALALKVGYKPGSAEDNAQKEWTAKRYHAVSDDLTQPVDRAAAAKFNQLVERLAVMVADATARPEWLPASFFRTFRK